MKAGSRWQVLLLGADDDISLLRGRRLRDSLPRNTDTIPDSVWASNRGPAPANKPDGRLPITR